jgi:hypothetical protein
MLKVLVSLEGLVLEAVRDEQAGRSACISGRPCRTLQASWCSMKLSTLQGQRIGIIQSDYIFYIVIQDIIWLELSVF